MRARPPAADLPAALAQDLDAAFEYLVRSEADLVFSVACRLLADQRDAEEVAQDAFLRAYRALAGYDRERIEALALRPWLAAITVNLARSRRRRAGRGFVGVAGSRRPDAALHANGAGQDEADPPTPEPVDPDPTACPPEAALRREQQEELGRCLAALPLRYRVPVVLRYVAGLTPAEVAATLARPEGTVRAQIHRGLARLRAAIDANGSSAAATGLTHLRTAAQRSPRPTRPPRSPEMSR